MKICTQCGKSKSIQEYAWKNKKINKKHSHCKTCQNLIIYKKRYNDYRQLYINNAKKQNSKIKERNREWIYKYKQKHACIKCGENNPVCLDFHHNSNDKKSSVSKLMNSSASINRIQQEIQKCDIVCANCHRKIHSLDKK